MATIPFFLNGFSLKAFGKGSVFEKVLRSSAESDRVLVIIQLQGGNDGLNTVIPIDQYSALSAARANILIPENVVLPLQGTTLTGLHPSMPEIQALFNNKEAMILQGVFLFSGLKPNIKKECKVPIEPIHLCQVHRYHLSVPNCLSIH